MSELRLHDTLSARLVPLAPREPGHVRIYVCGPTTYDVAHIGHARAVIAPDVLVRHLRGKGLRVTYVRNITDVDDKILKRASETGEPPMELSARMAVLYQEDMRAVGCLEPDVQPKVSEHIGDIVAFIEKLIEKGSAYPVEMPGGTRDVYYAVRSFPGYGKLSKRQIEELRVGARIEASEQKRDPLDFALWKGCAEDAWGWASPFGKGRPGWHIECSAMATRYLGHGFDVHGGGMDLVFPHHENEIAQSEAAHPDEGPFAHLWVHNGFVNVDKEKMAKSLGNFVTIRQVYERNDPEALRYFLLTVHYRSPIAFDTETIPGRLGERVVFPGVLEAERRVDYLYATLARLAELAGGLDDPGPRSAWPRGLLPFGELADKASARALEALDEDLNTPVALSAVADLAKAGNELFELSLKRKKDAKLSAALPPVAVALSQALSRTLDVLGLCQTPADVYAERTQAQRLRAIGRTAEEIEAMVRERAEARGAKDFARSDAIRKSLEEDGVEVADTPTGSTWRVRA